MNQLLTVAEVSELLGSNKNLVYSLIKHGHLRALKLGSLKVTSRELDDFMTRSTGLDFTDLANVVPLSINGVEDGESQ